MITNWGSILKIIFVCMLAYMFASFDQSLFGYAIPGIMGEFKVGLPAISLMMSMGFVVAAPVSLMMGDFADRFGRKKTLTMCLALSAFLVGCHAFSTDLLVLGVLRVVGFAVSAGVGPIVTTYAAETAPPRYRGLLIGIMQCGYPLGWLFASLATAPLIETYGWRAPFFTAFLVVPVAFTFLWLLPESTMFRAAMAKISARPFKDRVADLLRGQYRRRTILVTLVYFLFGASYAGSAFFFPTFLHETRGYSMADAARLVGLAYGIGIFGYLTSSVVGEFLLSRRQTFIIWTWAGSLGFAGFIWLAETPTENLLWFSALAIFGYGAMPLLQTMKAELFPTSLRATAAAISGGAGLNIGYAASPVIVAQAVETVGWQMAFSFTVIPALFMCGVLTLFLETITSGTALDQE